MTEANYEALGRYTAALDAAQKAARARNGEPSALQRQLYTVVESSPSSTVALHLDFAQARALLDTAEAHDEALSRAVAEANAVAIAAGKAPLRLA